MASSRPASPPPVVLDANLLYPFQLRNLLVQFGVDSVIAPRWTAHINEEWVSNLVEAGRAPRECGSAKGPDADRPDKLLIGHVSAGSRTNADSQRLQDAANSLHDDQGVEVMRALKKGQARAFNFTGDVRSEARIVERAFGLGTSAVAGVVQLLGSRLEPEAA